MRRVGLFAALVLAACGGGGGTTTPQGGGATACVSGSCPAGSHCDLGTNTCVPNTSACTAASCPAGTYCDAFAKQCTSQPTCLTGADCPSGWTCSGYVCVNATAGACSSSATCPPDRPLCNLTTHNCQASLACYSPDACPGGWDCVQSACQRLPAGTCKRDVDCASGAVCVANACVGCASSGAACAGALVACDAAANRCKPCGSAADCPANQVCTASGCAECGHDSDCPTTRPGCLLDEGNFGNTTLASGVCAECGADVGTCPSPQYCGSGYLCRGGATCSSDADCVAVTGKPRCDIWHSCVQCVANGDCPAGQECRLGACHAGPHGDSCLDPIALGTLPAGRKELLVSLAGFSCAGNPTPGCHDAFFRFTLAAESRVDLYAGGSVWSAQAELLADGCGAPIATGWFYSPSTPLSVYLPAGTYVLRFQGDAGTPYGLVLATTPTSLPAGNTCGTNLDVLAPDVNGDASRTATTTGLKVVSGYSCSSNPGPQGVYAVDLAQPAYVQLTATPLDTSFALDLDVKDDCAAALDRGAGAPQCNYTPNTPVTWTFAPMAAGRHYLVVDSVNGTTGQFRLDAFVNPTPWAANDVCANAQTLTFTSGVATASGTTELRASSPSAACFCALPSWCGDDLTGCQSAPAYRACGDDVFYAFSTIGQGDRKLDVSVIPAGAWTPAFTVGTACGLARGTLCGLGGMSTSANVLPEGDYVVRVASLSAANGGPFTLQLGLSAPIYPVPVNDLCASATALSPGVVFYGDTRGGVDDVGGACGASSTGSGAPDVAYAFTATARGRLDLAVQPYAYSTGGLTLQPVLRLYDACGGTQLGCAMASAAGQPASLPVFVTASTSRVVWVDGANATAGTFSLSATFTDAPSNDTCSGPAPLGTGLAGTFTASGDLGAAAQDGTCGGVGGPDVFYVVYLPGGPGGTATVTVTPSGFTAGLASYGNWSGSCGTTTCAASPVPVKGSAPGAPTAITLSGNKPVLIGVSGADGGRGTFTITAVVN